MGPEDGERYKQALDDLALQMKEEVLERTLWRTLFGRGYGTCCLERRRDGDEIIVICHVKCVGCRGNNTQYSNSIRFLEWCGLEFMGKKKNHKQLVLPFFGIRKCAASNTSPILTEWIVSFESYRVKQVIPP